MFTIRYLLVKGQSLHYMKYSCLDQCIYYTISLKLIYHKMREPACIGCSGPNVNFFSAAKHNKTSLSVISSRKKSRCHFALL